MIKGTLVVPATVALAAEGTLNVSTCFLIWPKAETDRWIYFLRALESWT